MEANSPISKWWFPERSHPNLRTILDMIVETARDAGHLDVVREMIGGQAGRFADDASMPGDDEIDWPAYVAKVEAAARSAHGSRPSDQMPS